MVDEIEKDAPNVRDMLSKYITRAVIDEVLPPSFLTDAVICNLGGDIVEHAKRRLSHDHNGALIEKGWGPGDGRPVEELKVAIDQCIQEYLLNGDLEEACACIKELQVPQFHHEVVKRAIVLSLDQKDTAAHAKVSVLFAWLASIGALHSMQAAKGFLRVYESLNDLILDTPAAKTIVDGFYTRAVADKVLPKDFVPPIQ
jgi:programmed cell death protein 4